MVSNKVQSVDVLNNMRLTIHKSLLSRLKSRATMLNRNSIVSQIATMVMDEIIKLHRVQIMPHRYAISQKFGLSDITFRQIYNLYTSLTFLTIFGDLSLAKGERSSDRVSIQTLVKAP
jgi:hypothetical protein